MFVWQWLQPLWGQRWVLAGAIIVNPKFSSSGPFGRCGWFTAQVGYLAETERHIGGSFDVPARRIDNSNSLIRVFPDHRLLPANTNFFHKKRYQACLSDSFVFKVLNSKWTHCHRPMVEWINRLLPDHFDPALWIEAILCTVHFLIAHRLLSREHKIYRHCTSCFWMKIIGFSSSRKQRADFHQNNVLKVQYNTVNRSRKLCIQRHPPRRTMGHVNLGSNGYPRLQVLRWMITHPPSQMSYTMGKISLWDVSWPRVERKRGDQAIRRLTLSGTGWRVG